MSTRILLIDDNPNLAIAMCSAIGSEDRIEGVACNSILDDQGNVPGEVMLLPAGFLQGKDGRSWINDRPQEVVAAFNAVGADIPFDWDHAVELKAPKGEPAPAAAWGSALNVREDGSVWCKVDWTEKGHNSVASKEYRYLSPVIVFDRNTKRVRRIESVALTNNPNLRLKALNSQQTQTEEEDMFPKELLEKLGLQEGATLEDVLKAIDGLKSAEQAALNSAQNPSLAKFVPRADYNTMEERARNAEQKIVDFEQKDLEGKVDAAIDKALNSRKIAPASKPYYKAMCMKEGGLEQFEGFLKSAPDIVAGSETITGVPPESDKALNASQKQLAEAFGNSEEDIKKYGGI